VKRYGSANVSVLKDLFMVMNISGTDSPNAEMAVGNIIWIPSHSSAIMTVPGGVYFGTLTSGATCFSAIPTRVSSIFQTRGDRTFCNCTGIGSKQRFKSSSKIS
jgi:hypothetical protein